jgi:hypothetical protein
MVLTWIHILPHSSGAYGTLASTLSGDQGVLFRYGESDGALASCHFVR